jgi:glycerophosphoryl diester phosphodiesterase
MSRPLKFGHRGAKGYLIENTVESILKAIELGVDGIEVDVHKCKSGELVVFHDFTVDRLTNGTGEISNFTLKELKLLVVSDH